MQGFTDLSSGVSDGLQTSNAIGLVSMAHECLTDTVTFIVELLEPAWASTLRVAKPRTMPGNLAELSER